MGVLPQPAPSTPPSSRKRTLDDTPKKQSSAKLAKLASPELCLDLAKALVPLKSKQGKARQQTRTQWSVLSSDWAASKTRQDLLPIASRLRALIVPGAAALVDVRSCDKEWYEQRSTARRARELADSLAHALKIGKRGGKQTPAAAKKAADAAEKARLAQKDLEAFTKSDYSVPKVQLLDFCEATLSEIGMSFDNEDADRAWRLLLARVLDVAPGLRSLTPLTVLDAVLVCYRASSKKPREWQSILTSLKRESLKGLSSVMLHGDETLSEPYEMFRDMVQGVPDNLLKPLLGAASVSYATMCSGTESPIIALHLISDACKELHGDALNFEHRFSCEIDPVKQGYIYRNFGVPILFRDIQELGLPEAHTAWNSKEVVPRADACVAGTSCVDFSTLNNKRKSLQDGGESGDTFMGLVRWVKKHRPILVVNENVMGKGPQNPWPEMQRQLEEVGYAARVLTFDSKEYYIPQTRMRRYMVAINVGEGGVTVGSKKVPLTFDAASKVLDDWQELVEGIQRPYTATLDHFLYPEGDPTAMRAKQQQQGHQGRDRKEVDWTRSLMRHATAREEHDLGDQRPLTRWDEGGGIHPPDDADWSWWSEQPSRVRDVAEVCFLRCVAQGQDPRHKLMYVNLSQNPERNDSSKQLPGLCPCLTPNEIPLITLRGGPIIAEERLKLQALPVDSLTFTRETQKDLSSLAGNAMTATVVGPVVLCAWLALVKAGYRRAPARTAGLPQNKAVEAAYAAAIKAALAGQTASPAKAVSMPRGSLSGGIAGLCQAAAESAIFCPSEMGNEVKGGIAACVVCGHAAHEAVRGSPCGFANFSAPVRPRSLAESVERELRSVLPPRILMAGIEAQVLSSAGSMLEPRLLEAWVSSCAAAVPPHGFVLHSVQRCRYQWRATWRNPADLKDKARLELVIGAESALCDASLLCEWRLFADPERCSARALRPLLRRHFAACKPDLESTGLLRGSWVLRVPEESADVLQVSGRGLGPSWERMLGLGFSNKEERLGLGISPDAFEALEIQSLSGRFSHLSGVYDRAPECGSANGSLHVRRGKSQVQMFLFREPDPVGHAETDRFVIATTHEKVPLGTVREHLAVMEAGWRPLCEAGSVQAVRATVPGRWEKLRAAALSIPTESIQMSTPRSLDHLALTTQAQWVAKLDLPAAACSAASILWGPDWHDVAKRGSESSARMLHWLRPAAAVATKQFLNWQSLPAEQVGKRLAEGEAAHDEIAPLFPSVQWVPNPKTGALIPQEHTEEAALFERARRTCPASLAALCRRGKRASGELLIAARPQVAALQAAAMLSNEVLSGSDRAALTLSYRIIPSEAARAPPPDELWVTLPDILVQEPLRGRYCCQAPAENGVKKSSGQADEVEYVREACGRARFTRNADGVWKLAGAGSISLESNGAHGQGILPHQVQSWCIVKRGSKKVDHRVLVEAKNQKTFILRGNEGDKAAAAVPPGWNKSFPLWKMQQQSLGWLRQMEADPEPYLQEAIESFEVPSLGLRMEGMAAIPTHGSRAVLADGVGFGKTAVVLARLCEDKVKEPSTDIISGGRIATKATLVLVPAHLVGQWLSEADKFIDAKRNLVKVCIADHKDLLKLSVRDIVSADLIVMNFEVLESKRYLQRLSDLATGGARSIDSQKGRHQLAMYKEVLLHLERLAEAVGEDVSCQGTAVEASRRASFEELRAEEGLRNITRKSMNALRKKRRLGEDVKTACSGRGGKLQPLWRKAPGSILEVADPPLELFEFRRVVCDEVSFVSGHASSALSEGIRGRSQLCLTGTPGLDSTRAVCNLARSIGTVIGPDEAPPQELGRGQSREATAAESFRHFLRTPDVQRYQWLTQRASQWIERFARHNEPSRAGIPVSNHLCNVKLTPLEQVLYVEKDRDLRGMDAAAMLRRGRGVRGGASKEERLRRTLGSEGLQSVQEVLIFQASCVENAQGSPAAVLARVRAEREQSLESAITEFHGKVRDLQSRCKELDRLPGGVTLGGPFRNFMAKGAKGSLVVDCDLNGRIKDIIDHASRCPKRDDKLWARAEKKSGKEAEEDDGADAQSKSDTKKADELAMELREGVTTQHGLNALLQEITSRRKVLRFFDAVAAGILKPKSSIKCDVSGQRLPASEAVVLPCGHCGCEEEVLRRVKAEGRCGAKGCMQQNVTTDDLVRIASLAVDAEHCNTSKASGPFGSKLACLTRQLQQVLAEDGTNRALVFCQMPPLMEMLQKALGQASVAFAQLQGTPQQMHETMERFSSSKGSNPRILLLMLDERCSGSNLTAANHIFFLHPVMRNGPRSAADIETQAVGRARRFGQTRLVHVWRFISATTLEDRMEAENQVERKG